jgi:hypothetical protein
MNARLAGLERQWRYVWRPLSVLMQPFASLTLEIILMRELSFPVPDVPTELDVLIRTARGDEIDWIGQFYREEPYLDLNDATYNAGPRPSGQWSPAKGPEAYRNRLARGEQCFVAFAGDSLAHINWLCFTFGEEPVPGRLFLLKPDECYTTDAVTLDGYRGKNIHAVVLGRMLSSARARGCRKAYTVTNIEHRASFKAFEQLGWRILGHFLCISPKNEGRSRLIRLGGSIEPLLRESSD